MTKPTAPKPEPETTDNPFPQELPRLLKARNVTLRSLARELGGIDHAYLSRMVNGKARVNADQAARIAAHLGLQPEYFPEVREALVIEAIKANKKLRDSLYFERVKKRTRSAKRPPAPSN
jgi:plasmid maintenance system antidote protein VapI